MNKPIPLRFVDTANTESWPTTLVLYAAATRAPKARAAAARLFGLDVCTPARWARAERLFTVDAQGLTVATAPARADIVFDPADNGHRWHDPGVGLLLKRSLAEDAPANEAPYPAWPRAETLDLTCEPAPPAERPVVSFCGVAHRPPERERVIEAFVASDAVDFRLTRRPQFNDPDRAGYLRSIRESHYVLCPRGVGRFSYRFYEALAAGRVPVLSSGHTVAPPALLAHAYTMCTESPDILAASWKRTRDAWPAVHARNRAAWLELASPLGWLHTLAALIRGRGLL